MVNKAFGNLVYDKSMSEYKENYRIRDLEESVRVTEDKDITQKVGVEA